VLRGGERILELDLDVAAPEHRALRDVVGHAARQSRHRGHDEARRDVGAAVERAEVGRRVHAGLVLRRDRWAGRARTAEGAAPQILQRAARYPQQEEVEHGEEGELQAD
jgi:hypothetical protein